MFFGIICLFVQHCSHVSLPRQTDYDAEFLELFEEVRAAPPLSPRSFEALWLTPSVDPFPSLHALPWRALKLNLGMQQRDAHCLGF